MELEAINGNWVQTNAYLLNEIKQIIEDYPTGQTINITVNPTPVTVEPTPVVVEVIRYIQSPITYIIDNSALPIIKAAPNQTVINDTIPINKTLILDNGKQMAYGRVCGPYNPINSRYKCCMDCVDKWLDDHKDGFEIKYLTGSGTGCKIKKGAV